MTIPNGKRIQRSTRKVTMVGISSSTQLQPMVGNMVNKEGFLCWRFVVQVGNLKELIGLCGALQPITIRKLALLSLMEVFKDIVPR